MHDKLRSQSWVFDLFIVSRTPRIGKFIVSRTPRIGKFKVHILAKVQIIFNFSMKSPIKSFLLFTKCLKVESTIKSSLHDLL